MNKIITLPIFLLLVSNVFASYVLPSIKLATRSATMKQAILPIKKQTLTKQKQPLTTIPEFAQESPVVLEQWAAREELQVVPQSGRSSGFLELLGSGKMLREKTPSLSQSSLTAKKSPIRIGREESVSALFYRITVADLVTAVEHDDRAIMTEYLAEENAIFDAITIEDSCNILMFAIKHGNAEMVMLLLRSHLFHLDDRDASGCTALMYAANNKDMLRVVVELLEQGASVNKKNKVNRSALFYAVYKPANIEITKELLKREANCDMVDDKELSALDYAVKYKNIDAVKLLLLHGIDKIQVKKALKIILVKHKEIHKNILQLTSLIQIQAAEEEDQKLLDIFENTKELELAYRNMHQILLADYKK